MNFKIAFTPQAESDWEFWKATDCKTAEKIKKILFELQGHPFTGTGKPEQLKYLFGVWSRRISHRDRIVYRINASVVTVIIMSMRFHYEDK